MDVGLTIRRKLVKNGYTVVGYEIMDTNTGISKDIPKNVFIRAIMERKIEADNAYVAFDGEIIIDELVGDCYKNKLELTKISNIREEYSKLDLNPYSTTYHGYNVNSIYQNSKVMTLSEDNQEVYMGYSPKKDMFYVGFDIFGGAKLRSTLKSVTWENGVISVTGQKDFKSGFYSGAYDWAVKNLKVIDLRLD